MLAAVHRGTVSLADADAIKADWERNHRFRMPFASFADVIGSSQG